MDATRHVGCNQRADVFVRDHALALGEPRDITAVSQCEVLQFTLTALVTNRAIQRVVNQQKFHHRLLATSRDF